MLFDAMLAAMSYRSLGERVSQQRLREVRRVAVPRSLARQHQPSATAAERASLPGLPPRIRCGRTGRTLACNSLRVAATRTKSPPLSSSPRLAPKLRPSPDSCAPSPFPRALPPVPPKYRCVCSVSRPRVCTVHGSPPPIQIGLTARASSTMTCLPASSLGRSSDRHTLEANQRLVFAPENRRSPFSRNARSPRANHPGRAERRGCVPVARWLCPPHHELPNRNLRPTAQLDAIARRHLSQEPPRSCVRSLSVLSSLPLLTIVAVRCFGRCLQGWCPTVSLSSTLLKDGCIVGDP